MIQRQHIGGRSRGWDDRDLAPDIDETPENVLLHAES